MGWTRSGGGDLDFSWFLQLPACLGTAPSIGTLMEIRYMLSPLQPARSFYVLSIHFGIFNRRLGK